MHRDLPSFSTFTSTSSTLALPPTSSSSSYSYSYSSSSLLVPTLPYDWYPHILLLCIVYGRLPRVIRRVILSSRYYINVGSRRVFDYDADPRSLDYTTCPIARSCIIPC